MPHFPIYYFISTTQSFVKCQTNIAENAVTSKQHMPNVLNAERKYKEFVPVVDKGP